MNSAVGETAIVQRQPVLVDLALQGGGSHGAFTWGVLDRLLEEPWLRIDAISGTSAGAMNAAVLADGWSHGGAEVRGLHWTPIWQRVSRAAAFSPLQRSPLERLMGRWTLDTSPAYLAMDMMSRLFSPYDLNPGGLQPAAPGAGREHRFRAPRRVSDQAVYHRHQRLHRPWTDLSQRPDHARGAVGLSVPADHVPGRRDRRRALLGRRLCRQSRPLRPSCARATRRTPSWSRSTAGSDGLRRRRAGDILTASTKSPSTRH